LEAGTVYRVALDDEGKNWDERVAEKDTQPGG
jgi:hypothetical protein